MVANKSLGQNFLIDTHVLETIIETAKINPKDNILEIGAGLGVLTKSLAEKASKVITVEIDTRLLPILEENLQELNNVELTHGDGLKFNLNNLPRQSLFVANLPYNIATAMILKILKSGRFKRLVCLVQKEVAQKICAQPNEKAFGSFSLIISHFAKASIIRHVKPGSFFPPPKVTSSIVLLNTYPAARPEETLFKLIYLAFKHRRKTLKKNLLMAGYESNTVIRALKQVGIVEMARAENLNLAQFKELAKLLA